MVVILKNQLFRSATMGSMRDARCAGIYPETSATAFRRGSAGR